MTVHYYELTKLLSTLYYSDTCNIKMFEKYILDISPYDDNCKIFVTPVTYTRNNYIHVHVHVYHRLL